MQARMHGFCKKEHFSNVLLFLLPLILSCFLWWLSRAGPHWAHSLWPCKVLSGPRARPDRASLELTLWKTMNKTVLIQQHSIQRSGRRLRNILSQPFSR